MANLQLHKNCFIPMHLEEQYRNIRVYLHFNTYSHSFATAKKLVQEARNDFPSLELTDSDFEFRTYRNTGYIDGIMGCEFSLPKDTPIPQGYHQVNNLPSY